MKTWTKFVTSVTDDDCWYSQRQSWTVQHEDHSSPLSIETILCRNRPEIFSGGNFPFFPATIATNCLTTNQTKCLNPWFLQNKNKLGIEKKVLTFYLLEIMKGQVQNYFYLQRVIDMLELTKCLCFKSKIHARANSSCIRQIKFCQNILKPTLLSAHVISFIRLNSSDLISSVGC